MGSIGRGGWYWLRGMLWNEECRIMNDEFGYGEDFTGGTIRVANLHIEKG